ncbi:MAG: class II glutamine amidotransferase, partial [Candidatus Heimdallarchaeota archaeon]|nr:class II glutamine amidotransferase [Candidatus Heimdallarchaeota archaeon]
MCGIVGIVQRDTNKIGKNIIDSLKKLEYRGYDSVGIATIDNNQVMVSKEEGKITEVIEKIQLDDLHGKIAIGHTRWATHGPPSKENSHPHTDCKNEIAVIHNGIIENFQSLKEELVAQRHVFRSETDTEIIPHLIEQLVQKEQMELKDAIIHTIR